MYGWLILLLLGGEVAVFSRLDRKLFGTWCTPFCLLAFPFTAVVLFVLLLAGPLGFVQLYPPALFIWIVGLFLVWAGGSLLACVFVPLRAPSGDIHRPYFMSRDESSATKLATILAFVAMPFILRGLLNSVRDAGGWEQIGSAEFKEAYSRGLHSHAQVLSALLLIILIGTYKKGKRYQLAAIIILMLFITLSQVKGHTFAVVIGALFFRVLAGYSTITLKKLSIFVLGSYLIFSLAYLIGMYSVDKDKIADPATYSYMARHYCFYLFGGPLAMGEAVRTGVSDVGGNWQVIFAPWINLHHVIFQDPSRVVAGSVHEKGMYTEADSSPVNVYTFFGTLYLYLGGFAGTLYVFITSLACYGFLIVVKRGCGTWLTAAYCFVMAQFSLGFFEFYFWHLDAIEVVGYAILISLIARRLRGRSNGRISHGAETVIS